MVGRNPSTMLSGLYCIVHYMLVTYNTTTHTPFFLFFLRSPTPNFRTKFCRRVLHRLLPRYGKAVDHIDSSLRGRGEGGLQRRGNNLLRSCARRRQVIYTHLLPDAYQAAAGTGKEHNALGRIRPVTRALGSSLPPLHPARFLCLTFPTTFWW